MDGPLISVIVPVYKVEAYLDECVQSIVDQTYRNLEILLVDDGSPDRCPQLCDQWAQKDSRVVVIHKANGGLSSARNSGLDAASGDYIGFVDSDDYVAPNMYEVLLNALTNTNIKIASCNSYRVAPDGTLNSRNVSCNQSVLSTPEALEKIFRGKIGTSAWRRLYERSIFDDIRFPVGEVNEDLPIIIPMFVKSGGIVHTEQPLYFYRIRGGSITSSYWKTDADIVLKNIKRMEMQIEANGLQEVTKAFRLYSAQEASFMAITLEQNYDQISAQAKENHRQYLKLMKKNLWVFLSADNVTPKEKMIYIMVLARVLRPALKLLGKL